MALDVSVLVPTYNRAHLLPATIESILSQSRAPAEVVVVDDGSTDGTREVLQQFGSGILYRRVENGGVCRARNIAASLATSPLLAFCDDDDLWRKDKLEKQMELHRLHPEMGFSFTNFRLVISNEWMSKTKFDEAPSAYFEGCDDDGQDFMVCDHSMYSKLLVFQPVFPSTHVIAKSLFESMGGYEESLGKVLSEDLEFALRCVQKRPIGIVKAPVVGIRKHSNNISGNTHATTAGEVEILRYALDHHSLSTIERSEIVRQIHLRQLDLSSGAFRRGDFEAVVSALRCIPSAYLTPKDRIRLLVSKLPGSIAERLQRVLIK